MRINVNNVAIDFDEKKESYVKITYTGKKKDVEKLRREIRNSYGMYGLLIGDPDFNLAVDIVHALRVELGYKFRMPKNLILYNPEIPEDAIP
jgi:hypothetical protein